MLGDGVNASSRMRALISSLEPGLHQRKRMPGCRQYRCSALGVLQGRKTEIMVYELQALSVATTRILSSMGTLGSAFSENRLYETQSYPFRFGPLFNTRLTS